MHYEVPSLSSMLYEYTNKERDAIVNAFRTGNSQSLRSLPNELQPFCVSQAIKESVQNMHLLSSIQSQNAKVHNELLKHNGGVFQTFAWAPDEYEVEKKVKAEYARA